MSQDVWSGVLLIGLWGWITSTLVFIFRAFPRRGVFVSTQALRWGACVLCFCALWIAGLLNA